MVLAPRRRLFLYFSCQVSIRFLRASSSACDHLQHQHFHRVADCRHNLLRPCHGQHHRMPPQKRNRGAAVRRRWNHWRNCTITSSCVIYLFLYSFLFAFELIFISFIVLLIESKRPLCLLKSSPSGGLPPTNNLVIDSLIPRKRSGRIKRRQRQYQICGRRNQSWKTLRMKPIRFKAGHS